jgi:hypothetical protein
MNPLRRLEEDPHLDRPSLEVSAQDRHLRLVRHLHCLERLHLVAKEQLAAAGHADVADPLRKAARRNEVLLALVAQKVDGMTVPFARLATAHPQDT